MTAVAINEPKRLLLTVVLCMISFEIGRLYFGDNKLSSMGSSIQYSQTNVRRRMEVRHHTDRKVYIDIGANNGDSFVDCKKFGIPGMCEDGTWDIAAVEANPEYNDILFEKRKSMLDKKLVNSIRLYNATAMDTSGRDSVDFAIDRTSTGFGSSLSADSLNFRNKIESKQSQDIIKLPTTTMRTIFEDASIKDRDFVVVKIDVEGFEYDLLPYLIIHGLLHRIDVLAVEYHDNNIWFYNGLSAEKVAEFHEQTKCLKWVVSKAERVKQYMDWDR
jgi:FkbM family methyltransferase